MSGKPLLLNIEFVEGGMSRSLACGPDGSVEIQEYHEVLESLFSFPGLKERFGGLRLSQLRQSAEASCFAIKGQEFLRRREYGAARRYFRMALRMGSRDIRDFLCWMATFSPALLRWAEPLYGTVGSQGY